MTKIKKISSVLLVMIIVFSMVIAVRADTVDTGNITINDKGMNGSYAGYLIMNSTNSQEDNARFAYTVNEKYIDILYSTIKNVSIDEASLITAEDKHENILRYLEDVELKDTDMRSFADKLYRNIRVQGLEPDENFVGGKKSETIQGYWLIADVTNYNGVQDDGNSVVIVDTVGVKDIEVKVKKSFPTVEKKVAETNDSALYNDTFSTNDEPQWQDAADYDVNDDIKFKVTGTLADNLSSYNSYYYGFHDLMTKMTYVDNSAKVYIDGKDYTDKFTVEWNASEKKLDVYIDDIMSIKNTKGKQAVTINSKVVLTYSAVLDENAVTGAKGNPNTVYLEYANDPYNSSSTGKTAPDTVVVFTYKIIVNKVIGKETQDEAENPDNVDTIDEVETSDDMTPYGKLLNGAGFTLFKMDHTGEYNPVGEEKRGGAVFEFYGIDAGTYKLVETRVPDGFNKAEDIDFVVVSVYDVESDYSVLRDLYVKDMNNKNITVSENVKKGIFIPNLSDGSLSVYVKNYSGTKMPSTGGTGTVLIYTLGVAIFTISFKMLADKLRKQSNK